MYRSNCIVYLCHQHQSNQLDQALQAASNLVQVDKDISQSPYHKILASDRQGLDNSLL